MPLTTRQLYGILPITTMVKNQINSTSISIEIEVPPKEIWNAVSDVTRVPEWSPECFQVIWKKPPSDNLIGAKFIGSNKRGWMRWKGYCEVTGALPEKNFSYNVRPLGWWMRPQTRWTWEIRAQSNFESVVTLRCEIQYVTPFGRLIFGTLEQRLSEISDGIQVTLSRLKSSLENNNIAQKPCKC